MLSQNSGDRLISHEWTQINAHPEPRSIRMMSAFAFICVHSRPHSSAFSKMPLRTTTLVTKLGLDVATPIAFSLENSQTIACVACPTSPEFWHRMYKAPFVPELIRPRIYEVFVRQFVAKFTTGVTKFPSA
jgi:hypothetical protein